MLQRAVRVGHQLQDDQQGYPHRNDKIDGHNAQNQRHILVDDTFFLYNGHNISLMAADLVIGAFSIYAPRQNPLLPFPAGVDADLR